MLVLWIPVPRCLYSHLFFMSWRRILCAAVLEHLIHQSDADLPAVSFSLRAVFSINPIAYHLMPARCQCVSWVISQLSKPRYIGRSHQTPVDQLSGWLKLEKPKSAFWVWSFKKKISTLERFAAHVSGVTKFYAEAYEVRQVAHDISQNSNCSRKVATLPHIERAWNILKEGRTSPPRSWNISRVPQACHLCFWLRNLAQEFWTEVIFNFHSEETSERRVVVTERYATNGSETSGCRRRCRKSESKFPPALARSAVKKHFMVVRDGCRKLSISQKFDC